MTHLFIPWFQAEDGNGAPRSGALLEFYQAGTTTPITVYADSGKAVSLGDTVTADAAGVFQPIWVDTSTYKTILKTATGVTVQTVDNIAAPASVASPVLTTPQINDTTGDHQYVVAVNELAADRTVTLPLLAANDEFVFADHAKTLKNKSLEDASTYFVDNSDPTKRVRIEASAVATGTTRVLNMPDDDVNLLPTADTDDFLANTPGHLLVTDEVADAGAEVPLTYNGSTIVVEASDTQLDFAKFINGVVTLTQASTLGEPINVVPGRMGRIRFVQDGTGSRTLAYHAKYEAGGGSLPVLSTAASTEDLLYLDPLTATRVVVAANKALGG